MPNKSSETKRFSFFVDALDSKTDEAHFILPPSYNANTDSRLTNKKSSFKAKGI